MMKEMTMNQVSAEQTSDTPWWKFGLVWMLIAGPAAVVLASFFTIYLAVSRPDPLVSKDYYKEGVQINQTLRAQREQGAAAAPTSGSLEPAQQARNHAQTGGVAVPQTVPAEEAAER